MDSPANKPVLRQTSMSMRVPSFNDFGSMVSEDVEMPTPRMSVSVPKPSTIQRGWSIDSNDMSPPGRLGSSGLSGSFSDTFRRALYEHMRGN
jgi:hypothetical protein